MIFRSPKLRSRSNAGSCKRRSWGQQRPQRWASCIQILAAAIHERNSPLSRPQVRTQRRLQLPQTTALPFEFKSETTPLASLQIHWLLVPCRVYKIRLNVLGKQDVLFHCQTAMGVGGQTYISLKVIWTGCVSIPRKRKINYPLHHLPLSGLIYRWIDNKSGLFFFF